MTSFYQQQELARQKSSWLVVYFIIAVVLVAGLTTMAIAIVLLNSKIIFSHKISTQEFPVSALAICFGITATIIGLTSWARMKRLKSGGGAFIAAHLGGRRLSRETASPQEKVLLNVVEEMAIASGCRVPQVFVLDHEQSINAFAAGFDIHTCVIGVTQGLLDQMNRDELQGVIGHEFSHILNGDMKLNLQLTGWLAGILVISEIGLVLMRSTSRSNSRRNKDGGAQIILGIVLWVIGSIGLLAAKIIKAGFSKQREYLADASAVQFTRNPLGIGSALVKIQAHSEKGKVRSPYTEEVSHMFIANALSLGSGLFATHPPLEDRIRRISPNLLQELGKPARKVETSPEKKTTIDNKIQTVAILASLPQQMREDLSDTQKAMRQVEEIFFSGQTQIPRAERFVIFDLALETLKKLDEKDKKLFLDRLVRTMQTQGTNSVFRNSLLKLAELALLPTQIRFTGTTDRLGQLLTPIHVLMSALAYSTANAKDSLKSFNVGMHALSLNGMTILPREQCSGPFFLQTLSKFQNLRPLDAEKIVVAMKAAIQSDGHCSDDEWAVLKAVSSVLGVPLGIEKALVS